MAGSFPRRASGIFGEGKPEAPLPDDMKELHLKMGESRLMNASLQAFSPMQKY
jgi:hypothetical protein